MIPCRETITINTRALHILRQLENGSVVIHVGMACMMSVQKKVYNEKSVKVGCFIAKDVVYQRQI